MTPSELKYQVERAGHDSHFFTRSTMKFFGDTMRNYGVCTGPTFKSHYDNAGNYTEKARTVETWELYRKHPVKHGLNKPAYFDKQTFRRVFPEVTK